MTLEVLGLGRETNFPSPTKTMYARPLRRVTDGILVNICVREEKFSAFDPINNCASMSLSTRSGEDVLCNSFGRLI